jgi:hypothetical protein
VPIVIAVAVVLLAMAAFTALVPLSLALRYRAGTARRRARGWVAAVNVLGVAVSAALFLLVAALTSLWVPRALTYSLAGLGGGCVLGAVGLWRSRWEAGPDSLHYTPNRWLVLAIMLVVTSRMFYGLWRAWHTWHVTPDGQSWLAASGAAGSLAAGAVAVGYYLSYSAGVWLRLRRHRRASTTVTEAASPRGGRAPSPRAETTRTP